ncbi:hypothetical protein [Sphingobacterium sp. 2149]|nr:hypothetical protein [Sphingobacterium sp. 2149]MDR6733890.1 hypothetical protein [Sphingobacterium sp. 2149]
MKRKLTRKRYKTTFLFILVIDRKGALQRLQQERSILEAHHSK